MKTCVKCKQNKPYDEFHKYSLSKDGKHYYCKICKCESERLGRIRNYSKQRGLKLKQNYKIEIEDFNKRLKDQNYTCAICNKPETAILNGKVKVLSVDHNRACCSGNTSCGKCVRKLLCCHCNRGLGAFNDGIELFEKAILYLKEFK